MHKNQINISDEIKSRCNIVDIIGRVVTLKRAGSNYKGLCPFHNEKTPSFIVSENKQIYKCFGCGESGDVIGFVKKYYNLEFREAVEMLAREYGIDIDGAFAESSNKKELYEINRQAARYFYKALRAPGCPGYEYMTKRGLSDETLRSFGIGYADDQWTSLTDYLTSLGFEKEKLYKLGLLSRSEKGRYYDKFRGRVIFPIINTGGNIIGFGGRIIGDGEPKYLNSQETKVFQKKNNLYGLNLAKNYIGKDNRLILVEGYMDVISLYQAGVRNVSASLGTALTDNQAKLISRFTKNVILSYDADSAGQNAAERGVEILYRNKLNAKVLKVNDGKDPDEFISRNGRRAFLDLADNALSFGDFIIGRIVDKYNLEDDQQRAACANEAIAVFSQMRPVDADIYLKKMSKLTGISEMALKRQMSGANNQPLQRPSQRVEETVHGDMTNIEKNLLKLATINKRYAEYPGNKIEEIFNSQTARGIFMAISEIDESNYPVDRRELSAMVEAELLPYVDEIIDIAVSPDKEQQMYNDCIRYVQREKIKREIRDVSNQMEMGEGLLSDEQMGELMSKLIELQKQIKG